MLGQDEVLELLDGGRGEWDAFEGVRPLGFGFLDGDDGWFRHFFWLFLDQVLCGIVIWVKCKDRMQQVSGSQLVCWWLPVGGC